jgi:uncharacterized protein YraI
MIQRRGLVLLVFLFLALSGCLPRGQALLPNVPTRTPVVAANETLLTVVADSQVYAGPGRAYVGLREVAAGTTLLLQGRLVDGSWLAVVAPAGARGGLAWVAAEDVVVEGEATAVPVLAWDEPANAR